MKEGQIFEADMVTKKKGRGTFLVAQMVKNLPAVQETQVQSPGQ